MLPRMSPGIIFSLRVLKEGEKRLLGFAKQYSLPAPAHLIDHPNQEKGHVYIMSKKSQHTLDALYMKREVKENHGHREICVLGINVAVY